MWPCCCQWRGSSGMRSRWEMQCKHLYSVKQKKKILLTFSSCLVEVFDLLKGAIIKNFKDEQLQQGSKFLQDLLPGHCSVAQMVLDTVKNRWDAQKWCENQNCFSSSLNKLKFSVWSLVFSHVAICSCFHMKLILLFWSAVCSVGIMWLRAWCS